MNSGSLRRTDRLIGLAVSLICVGAYLAGLPPTQRLERGAYDIGVAASIKPASSQVVIIDIDKASIDRIGHWPWPPAQMAGLITRLASAGTRQIGLDLPPAALRPTPADDNAVLATAIRRAGNVVLPMRFDLHAGGVATPNWLARIGIPGGATDASPPQAIGVQLPANALAKAAADLGYVNVQPGPDGVIRSAPLLIRYQGRDFPSLPLAMAAVQLHRHGRDIRIAPGPQVSVGPLRIPTDARMQAWPVFHTSGRRGGFKHYAFADVMAGKVPVALFRHKTVLVGITAGGIGKTYRTPVNARMHAVEFDANMLQSILHRGFFTHPAWAHMLELAILALVAAYLVFLLPLLGAGAAAVISILLLLALLSVNFFALTTDEVWIRTLTAGAMLVLGHVLLAIKRQLMPQPADNGDTISADAAASHRMLGLSFQSQGMLEVAFDKFRRCPLDTDMLAILYKLALDFERKRQFDKALDVYAHMASHDAAYKDIQARMQRAREHGMATTSPESGLLTLSITGGAKPMLGRYEIIKELGKGAMGTVYLGRDPKINREVAIKTLALSEEFEPDELEDVKARFFREAETAGRLMHPNIVTIFDAGEEKDLAYIAMEYLNGTDLSPFTKQERLLPAAAVLKITGKVAEALHYAHQQGVIHRDIKPANIMLLRDKTVKVTDFGIARITASSKTKTGVVLGTPSYMSPEQLSGQHVDARSDLFSMGIMLYEMLAGTRPFRGDSMSNLMFQIANEPHPDIRSHNPRLPESIATLIDRLLAKTPAQRPGSGAEVVRALIACLKDLKAAEKTA